MPCPFPFHVRSARRRASRASAARPAASSEQNIEDRTVNDKGHALKSIDGIKHPRRFAPADRGAHRGAALRVLDQRDASAAAIVAPHVTPWLERLGRRQNHPARQRAFEQIVEPEVQLDRWDQEALVVERENLQLDEPVDRPISAPAVASSLSYWSSCWPSQRRTATAVLSPSLLVPAPASSATVMLGDEQPELEVFDASKRGPDLTVGPAGRPQ